MQESFDSDLQTHTEDTRDYELEKAEEIEALRDQYEVAQSWHSFHEYKAKQAALEMLDIINKLTNLGAKVP